MQCMLIKQIDYTLEVAQEPRISITVIAIQKYFGFEKIKQKTIYSAI